MSYEEALERAGLPTPEDQYVAEVLGKAVDTLSSFMWECDIPYHYGMAADTWEAWALERVEDFHRVVGFDLKLLTECDMGTLGHDINGICSYWDMESHSMRDCFLPRCASHG